MEGFKVPESEIFVYALDMLENYDEYYDISQKEYSEFYRDLLEGSPSKVEYEVKKAFEFKNVPQSFCAECDRMKFYDESTEEFFCPACE
jgi:hypothetical protein